VTDSPYGQIPVGPPCPERAFIEPLFLSLLLAVVCHLSGIGSVTAQNFRQHIVHLSSVELEGRAPGTEGERLAAKYISNFLVDQVGIDVSYQPFSFPVDEQTGDSSVNVIGGREKGFKKTVVLCAHYDHLGLGSAKSREVVKKHGLHPGADDNASGVAMVLELAASFKADALPFNLVLLFPSAHEVGLFGSQAYSELFLNDTGHLHAVLNFDMVGRLDRFSQTIRVGGASQDSIFKTVAEMEDDRNGLVFRYDDSNIEDSDLRHFVGRSERVLHFTTGVHQDYHRRSDTEEKINYDGMQQIFELVRRYLLSL